jgi:hypothetical protein
MKSAKVKGDQVKATGAEILCLRVRTYSQHQTSTNTINWMLSGFLSNLVAEAWSRKSAVTYRR